MFKIVVGYCRLTRGIGFQNRLPWSYPKDLQNFKKVTTHVLNESKQNAVIMGKNTWMSLPKKPLKGRVNIVLSKSMQEQENCIVLKNINDVMRYVKSNKNIESSFVIGGEQIYKEFLNQKLVSDVYATEIHENYKCDTYFPKLNNFVENSNVEFDKFSFVNYKYNNIEEQQYLTVLKDILHKGIKKEDRTNTGTLSTFGNQMKFDLSNDTFPLLTSKKTFFRGIVEELLWFLSGNTDAKTLMNKKIYIWNGNTSREFLDKKGLTHYPVGDIGPTYSFNFRHYGAQYFTCNDDYTGFGYDQVKEVLRMIKEEPNSRRIIINLWEPTTIDKVALPPCMFFYQFYVDTVNKKLNCHCVIRSSDTFLGLPFNIGTGALITNIFAHLTDLTPGELTITTSDTHIYLNHIKQCTEQVSRLPRPFPKLKIKRKVSRIEDFKYEDFELLNYNPYPEIKGKMAI